MPWYDYEPTRRRHVLGGIKAQSKRGSFGATWWGRRWMDTLEGFDVSGRIARGRSYARSGQVLSIDVEAGRVRADVQGSRPTPYAVTIRLAAYDAVAWAEATRAIRRRPYFAARLLGGALPTELDAILADADLSLFPRREGDLTTDCSCPDWSNPCKHIAAVYCLLAEEFDRDPFLLFRLRGLEREALLEQVAGVVEEASGPSAPATPPSVPLAADARFWEVGPLPDDLFGDVRTPPTSAALPRRLGGFPFWRAAAPFLETLEATYRAASPRGLARFEGDAETA